MRSAEPWSSAPLMSASVGLDRVKTKADPIALTIGHFYERAAAEWLWDVYSDCAGDVARNVARLLYGQHIVGAVPSFDASFLRQCMLTNGEAPTTWRYHLIDVEVLIAGKLGIHAPWKSDELSRALGMQPPNDEDRHTAIGDTRWGSANVRGCVRAGCAGRVGN